MRIALVANPTSGRGRHGGAAHAAITALLTAGHDVIVVQGSSYDESRANATALLEHDGGVDALVVVGGDGTVHLGLDVVATTDVPLGIIAVGTGNDIARHLRLPPAPMARPRPMRILNILGTRGPWPSSPQGWMLRSMPVPIRCPGPRERDAICARSWGN